MRAHQPSADRATRASTEPSSTVSALTGFDPSREQFHRELCSVLADCSQFLADCSGFMRSETLADRCEAMLSQVVADKHELDAELDDLRRALIDHNEALRSAASVAARDGRGTNWLTFRGHVHWTLAEHHEITNEARANIAGSINSSDVKSAHASAIEARSDETRSGSAEGESAVPNGETPR